MLNPSIKHFQDSMERSIKSLSSSSMSVIQELASVHQAALTNPSTYNPVEHFKAMQSVLQTAVASQQALTVNLSTAMSVYFRESTSEIQDELKKSGMGQISDVVGKVSDFTQETVDVAQKAVSVANECLGGAPMRKTSPSRK